MVRSVGRDQMIPGSDHSHTLDPLLQAGLRILERLAPSTEFAQVGPQRHEYKTPGSLITLVQVYCRHQRFEGFFQYRFASLSARFQFALSQFEVIAQGEAASRPGQAGAADQGGTPLGQFTFSYPGKVLEQFGGNDQFKDGIAKELHPFVRVQRRTAMLVEVGTMNQGLP